MEGIYFCYNCIKVIHQHQLTNSRQIICPFCQSLEVEIYNGDNIELDCLIDADNPIAYSETLNRTYDMLLRQIGLLLNNESHHFDSESTNENDNNNYTMERDENNHHHETADEDYNNNNNSDDSDSDSLNDSDYTDDDTGDSSDDDDSDDSDDYYESSEENNSSMYFTDGHESYLSENDDTDTSAYYWRHGFYDISSNDERESGNDSEYVDEDDNEHEDDGSDDDDCDDDSDEDDDNDEYSFDENHIIDEDSDDSSLWETLDEDEDEDEDEEGEINDNNDSDDDGIPNLPELLTSILLSEQRETNSLPDAILVRESRINISDGIQNSLTHFGNRFRGGRMTQDFTLLTQFIEIHFSQLAESNPRPDLSKLKHRNLKDDDSLLKTKTECIICKEVYEMDICVTKMPCGHEYHQECLIHWLKQNPTCPICRQPMDTMDDTN